MILSILRPNKIAAFIASLLILSPLPVFSASREALKKSPAYEAIPAKVVARILLPEGYHEGLFSDGGNIWVANGEKGKVWVIDTESGRRVFDIESIAGFTEAISRKSEDLLFVTDWDEKKLYKARLENDKLKPEAWVSLSPAHPAGVVWNGEKLFVITWTRGMGTKFDLLEMDGGMKLLNVMSIQDIQEPAHMAWDGKYLWITSWYDPLVYKIDMKKREIIGAFRSPVSRTTGISWDGKNLWLTGTYSDLYKMEIAR
ncbi:MAG: hypothetical protein PHS46_00210 [Candidatus Omnitrophica bacterium]|nr:hypothetical protein [Candidatus Omnitrophota bacterium]